MSGSRAALRAQKCAAAAAAMMATIVNQQTMMVTSRSSVLGEACMQCEAAANSRIAYPPFPHHHRHLWQPPQPCVTASVRHFPSLNTWLNCSERACSTSSSASSSPGVDTLTSLVLLVMMVVSRAAGPR